MTTIEDIANKLAEQLKSAKEVFADYDDLVSEEELQQIDLALEAHAKFTEKKS